LHLSGTLDVMNQTALGLDPLHKKTRKECWRRPNFEPIQY
jgi:hypothetical protein